MSSDMKETLGMTQSIKLPSQGLVYPEGHPFHKKTDITINLLTGADENLLTTKSLIQSGQLTDKLLKRILVDDVDVDSLLLGDKYAALIFARIYSMGTDYQAIATCEYCGETDKYDFDLSNVPVKFLDESAIQVNPYTNLFEFTTNENNVIKFKLSTVQLARIVDRDIEAERNFNKKRKLKDATDRLIFHTYRNLIVSINDVEERTAIDEFLKGSIAESRQFREHMKTISPTVEFNGQFYCMNCGKDNVDVPLDFNHNFFWSNF